MIDMDRVVTGAPHGAVDHLSGAEAASRVLDHRDGDEQHAKADGQAGKYSSNLPLPRWAESSSADNGPARGGPGSI